ncbi:hypothetical protein [Halomonas elongata]|uniref:hypothetical protein n=1 Tax=Halomonas elongata TaxID=2746 RepID=UPI0023AE7ADF|nr:hypothetical protein [Halomonas elongata]
MNTATTQHAVPRLDVTTKAMYRGLCPSDRNCMVHMEQPLLNEVVMLSAATSAHERVPGMFWLDLIDGFMDSARDQLAGVPSGCRVFDCEVEVHGNPSVSNLPCSLRVHVEVQRFWHKQVLVFSLAGHSVMAA